MEDQGPSRAAVIRRLYELFDQGSLVEAAELFALDAVWRIPGTSAISGVYTGRDEITSVGPKMAALSNGTVHV
jgi:ketosteroid isomerase-like protein